MNTLPDSKYVSHISYLGKHDPFGYYICLNKSTYLKQLLFSLIQKKMEIKEKHPPEIFTFFGKEMDWQDWLDKVESNSFFSSQKIIFLKNFSTIEKKKIKSILALPEQENSPLGRVIVLEDALNMKEAQAIFGKKMDSSWHLVEDVSLAKKQWIGRLQKRFEWYQLSPPISFIEKLMKHTLMDIDLAIEQADRWGLQLNGSEEICWDEIPMEHLHFDQTIVFHLSDALLTKNYTKSLRIYFDLVSQGKSPEEILYFLLNHCLMLGKVKTVLEATRSSQSVQNAFKEVNSFRLGKLIQQASEISSARLNEAIQRFLDIDKKIKSQSDQSLETMLTVVIGSL